LDPQIFFSLLPLVSYDVGLQLKEQMVEFLINLRRIFWMWMWQVTSEWDHWELTPSELHLPE
ncbi:5774_t:CDS:2, partial [Gigaspora margarita]